MISLINHDSQWGRSEVVIICPDIWKNKIHVPNHQPDITMFYTLGHNFQQMDVLSQTLLRQKKRPLFSTELS